MICSLTGEVASEKVSKARKLFDKFTRETGLSVMAKTCLIAKSTDCARILKVGHNEPAISAWRGLLINGEDY